MPPSAATALTQDISSHASSLVSSLKLKGAAPKPANRNSTPLKSSGSLDGYQRFDVTPVIGTEFPLATGVQIVDLLNADNSDELIRDLAILVSQRGVVFFRGQRINLEEQKELGRRLGELSGKPDTSKLHTHPLTPEFSELGDQISVISSERRKQIYLTKLDDRPNLASFGWHADITFEKVPSDYAILKIKETPRTGGDTLWASGYEAYDRLSPAYQTFLEGLTATHNASRFKDVAARGNFAVRDNRGAPENVGVDDAGLTSVHPVIRTNPVTGWKGLFVNRGFTKRINELTRDESDAVLEYLFKHISENHDLQVRFKWSTDIEGEGPSLAIWDNRSVFHTATDDYLELGGVRTGDRVVSLGEKPYLDPSSTGRREALGWPEYTGQTF